MDFDNSFLTEEMPEIQQGEEDVNHDVVYRGSVW